MRGWRDRLGQIMQGLLGHVQDFSLYPQSDGMLLGVEMKAPQHQICILRSLVVWRLLRPERMTLWTMQKREAWGKARLQLVPSTVGQ